MTANIIFETPDEKIVVARFAQPDVREALYDCSHEHHAISDSRLYSELHTGGIIGLPAGGTFIVNFHLIDAFSSAFYRLLLQARQDLKAKHCRLLLCCLTKHANEAFTILGGPRTFEVFTTEPLAIAEAKK
jgi:hypothetical protein